MLKQITVLSLVVFMIILSSCSLGGSRVQMLNNDNDGQMADTRFEQVIESIKTKDRDMLKAIFSEKALGEAEDLDEGIDYLFEFVKGDIESWKQETVGVSELNNSGKVKKVRSWYNVKTNQEEYIFLIVEYTVDISNPQNIGVYMIQAIKSEDRDLIIITGQSNLCAGIYRPAECQKNN